ncbi:uncharacterized protein ASPGLDRAFT_147954 [Aspergillus glaucus CBS 516.65]|uniref:F-box domain-containing protein n=1 Tax=Aspergillus glaucus CBS 516.65 TaxID=1160497 RepID=A0A1L9VMK7_ASPGL|nr:hypothetical protein ASPGLDRAFT_147954 [Aspergillus glaucus CBS 516.65]OJJ85156.1 hypothetical protein ASPGLDRAFT_147954 [Aspergillus glaucus CBS 516.65]
MALNEQCLVTYDTRDHILDEKESLCPLISKYPFVSVLICSLGTLDQLPLEALNMVLLQFDVHSLMTSFGYFNRRARQLVPLIPEYSKITLRSPVTIRAIRSIGTGASLSLQTLWDKLHTAKCKTCGDFGEYLYLITCRRVCFDYFTNRTDYLPFVQANVLRIFELHQKHLAAISSMKSVPGCYSTSERRRRSRFTLFDYNAGMQTGLAIHGSLGAMNQHALGTWSKKATQSRCRKTINWYGSDLSTRNLKRFMGIARAGVLNARTGVPEWGLHCSACRYHWFNSRRCIGTFNWRRKLTRESFEDHTR